MSEDKYKALVEKIKAWHADAIQLVLNEPDSKWYKGAVLTLSDILNFIDELEGEK